MSNTATKPVSDWSRRLVTALMDRGLITAETGEAALAEAGQTSRPVAAVLVSKQAVDPHTALEEMSQLSGLKAVDILEERPMPEAMKLLPEMLARQIGAIGYRVEGDQMTLASAEPIPTSELTQLSDFLERNIVGCVLADPLRIERVIETVYARLAETAAAAPAPSSQAVAGSGGNGQPSGPLSAPPPDVEVVVLPSPEDGPRSQPETIDWPPAEATSPSLDEAAAALGASAADELDGLFAGGFASPELSGGFDLDDLLMYAVEHGASDLHLTNMLPPTIRVDGSLRPIDGAPTLNNETIREMVYRVLRQSHRERFEAEKELDTAHRIVGVGRFRVNVFQQRGSIGAVFRAIPHEIPEFDTLGLPEVVASFAELRRGLVLVTGPTGSGKSTTLASLIDIINRTKPLHIVTVEDPIEFLHNHKRAIVNQREVGDDTTSFSQALRRVLRQDPDVILVGEMRDIETISTALTAAETGHLVFATLHTQDAPQTIDRIIDVFPTAQQDEVRVQLAGTLQAVITQQLILAATGTGREAVAEVMVCTPAIRNLIRSAKTHQIYSLMQTGGSAGMQTMDQGLARAVKANRISEAVAFDRCHDPSELRDHLKG
jgi:twitching motility protein PilT